MYSSLHSQSFMKNFPAKSVLKVTSMELSVMRKATGYSSLKDKNNLDG